MDDRSLNIVSKLSELLQNNQMRLEEFPQDDVIAMLNASYIEERERKDREWSETMIYMKQLFNEIEENRNIASMVELLGAITNDTCDLYKYTKLKLTTNGFKNKAKEIYEKHYRNREVRESVFTGKGVIYTVITGDYDVLQEPDVVDDRYKYVCFTNNPKIESSVWEIRMIDNDDNLDNARLSRKPKILCHEFLKEFDYSVYLDGKLKIIGDISSYIEKYSKGCAMLCFPHFVRECAYQEAVACIKYGKDDANTILRQIESYKLGGFPANYGLIDAACMVRSHRDKELQEALELWWEEVRTKSKRDQLSFGYAFWKKKIDYDICDLFTYDNPYICKKRAWEEPY